MRRRLITRVHSGQQDGRDRMDVEMPPGRPDAPTDRFPVAGLLILATAIFTSMVAEFLPGGLIPLISSTFNRSSADVGQLVTLFALTVILSAAPLAIATRRAPRKTVLLAAFALIGLANVLTALAPSFEFLLFARVLGGLAHGLFWSIVAAYPAHLVAPGKLARAIALTGAGGSVAGVAGLPLGNALGQALGWRWAFGTLACIGVVVAVLLALFLPPVRLRYEPQKAGISSVAREPKTTLRAILMVCFLILAIVAAQNSYGTYMVVWLVEVVGFPMGGVPAVLLAMGISSALGVAVAGTLYPRFPLPVFLGALSVLVGLLIMLPIAAAAGSLGAVLAIILAMGTAFGAIPTILQTRMMQSATATTRNLAAALQTTAFNVGIGGGAFLGGLVIAAANTERGGAVLLPHVAALGMLLALISAVIWEVIVRRSHQRASQTDQAAAGTVLTDR